MPEIKQVVNDKGVITTSNMVQEGAVLFRTVEKSQFCRRLYSEYLGGRNRVCIYNNHHHVGTLKQSLIQMKDIYIDDIFSTGCIMLVK